MHRHMKHLSQGPASRRSNIRAAGLSLFQKQAENQYGELDWADLNREQGMNGPRGGANRHGILGGIGNFISGGLHTLGGGIGELGGAVARGVGNVTDATGMTKGWGDAARAGQAVYGNMAQRGLHSMWNPMKSNSVNDYWRGRDNSAIDRHNPLALFSDENSSGPAGEWQKSIDDAHREGGAMGALAYLSQGGNYLRNIGDKAVQWALPVGGNIKGVGALTQLLSKAPKLGRLSNLANKTMNLGDRISRVGKAGGRLSTTTAGAYDTAFAGNALLGGDRTQSVLGLEAGGENTPEAQEYNALSPEQRAMFDAYRQSQGNELAATNMMSAADAKKQVFRNTIHNISRNGWQPLAATPSTRPLNYLADTHADLNNPELAELVGHADNLGQKWIKHLDPQLRGQLDLAQQQGGQLSPELQARVEHYRNAVRHNIIGEITKPGAQDTNVSAAFLREHLPEQHREGFSSWMSGKAGPSQELTDALHDVKAHYNIANNLGWTKAIPKSESTIDVNNLWNAPATAAVPVAAAPAPVAPTPAPTSINLPAVTQAMTQAAKAASYMPRIYSRFRPHTIKQWMDKLAEDPVPAGTPVPVGTPPEDATPQPATDENGNPVAPSADGSVGPAAPPTAPATPDQAMGPQSPPTVIPPPSITKTPDGQPALNLDKLAPSSPDTAAPPGGGAPTTPGTAAAPAAGPQQPAAQPGNTATPGAPAAKAPAAQPPVASAAAKAAWQLNHLDKPALDTLHAQVSDKQFLEQCKTNPTFFDSQGKPQIERYMKAQITATAEKEAEKTGSQNFNPEEWAARKQAEVHAFMSGKGNLSPDSWNTAMETWLKENGPGATAPTGTAQQGATPAVPNGAEPPAEGGMMQYFMNRFSKLWEGTKAGDPKSMAQLAGLVIGIPTAIAGFASALFGDGGIGSWIAGALGLAGVAGGAGMLDGLAGSVSSFFGGGEKPAPGAQPGQPAQPEPLIPGMPAPGTPGKAPGTSPNAISAAGPSGTPPGAPGAPGATGQPAKPEPLIPGMPAVGAKPVASAHPQVDKLLGIISKGGALDPALQQNALTEIQQLPVPEQDQLIMEQIRINPEFGKKLSIVNTDFPLVLKTMQQKRYTPQSIAWVREVAARLQSKLPIVSYWDKAKMFITG